MPQVDRSQKVTNDWLFNALRTRFESESGGRAVLDMGDGVSLLIRRVIRDRRHVQIIQYRDDKCTFFFASGGYVRTVGDFINLWRMLTGEDLATGERVPEPLSS